jgi:hypothetical protein
MTENEKEFDEVFKDYGGIYIPSDKNIIDFISAATIMAKNLQEWLKPSYPNLPDINFNFIDTLLLNACATKYKGKYFIGLNIGSFFLLHDMFLEMFASNDILPHLGNISLETEEKKNLKAMYNWEGKICFNPNDVMSMPLDIERIKYAAEYGQMAVQFFLLHELGHIIRGHTDYKSRLNENSFLSELNNKENNNGILSWVSQTLEMDADSFAINRILLIDEGRLANMEANNFKPIYKDWGTVILHEMFVIYSAFKLWDIDVLDIDKAQEYSHPPNSIRISLMEINIVSIFLEKYKSENIKNIISKIRESSKIAEDAFVKITFKLSTHDTFIMNTIMGQDYIKYIRYNWNKVRPLLEPFAFGTLPPLQVSE